jgi:hypothetical protein
MNVTATQARQARDTRLDIVRGLLQLCIFASHIDLSWIGNWLLHKAWGFSDSSEQFIFLSGVALAGAFGRILAKSGFAAPNCGYSPALR